MLNALADKGEVNLLAVMVNTMPSACTAAVSVLQHFYGRDEVPIGAYFGTGRQRNIVHPYVSMLANHWPSPIRSSSQVPDATVLYRRVLASQPDHSVAIASVGMLSNLESLLRSSPDEHSELDGAALVARKVRQIGIMAGRYPDGVDAWECNMDGDNVASAYVLQHLPPSVEVFFLGFEVGIRVMTGAILTRCAAPTNPCRQAYIRYLGGPNRNRPSWDPLTALVLARNVSGAHLSPCTNCDGYNTVGDGDNGIALGRNIWQLGSATNQTYLAVAPGDAQAAADVIDELLCQTPAAALRPRPPPAPPSAPPPPYTWVRHAHYNCYDGKGARDIEIETDEACCTVANVDECARACDEMSTSPCDAFVITREAPHLCFRRTDLHLTECVEGDEFDTYQRMVLVPPRAPPALPPSPSPPSLPPPPSRPPCTPPPAPPTPLLPPAVPSPPMMPPPPLPPAVPPPPVLEAASPALFAEGGAPLLIVLVSVAAVACFAFRRLQRGGSGGGGLPLCARSLRWRLNMHRNRCGAERLGTSDRATAAREWASADRPSPIVPRRDDSRVFLTDEVEDSSHAAAGVECTLEQPLEEPL